MARFRRDSLIMFLTLCGVIHMVASKICVHMKYCPIVYELLKVQNGQDLIEKLICKRDSRYPKVWCDVSCVTSSNESGFCSLSSDCLTTGKEINDERNNVNSCDIEGSTSKENYVCCPVGATSTTKILTDSNDPKTTETTTEITPETIPENITETSFTIVPDEPNPAETTSETNINLRQNQPDSEICGIQSDTNKIANGKIASMQDHPWSALLQYSEKGKLAFKCGGTLISNKYVLTAAHCVHGTRAKLLNVVLGEYNVSSPLDCFLLGCMPKPVTVGIRNIIVHPGWLEADRPFYDDIALIELKNEISYNDFLRPICLSSLFRKTEGRLIVAGWGKTEFGELSDVKRVAQLEVQPKSACLNTVRIPLKESQLCVGGSAADSCDGDSGGPLMDIDYSGFEPVWKIVGIVSLGSGKCGSLGKPAIYTNVSYYYEWILNEII